MNLSELLLKEKKYTSTKQIVLNYKDIRQIGSHQSFQWISTLCLSHNNLQNLKGIEQFTCLASLSIHHNQIMSVNELNRIKQPQNLKLLNVHHNPFTLNPNYITEILLKFKKLNSLDTHQNIDYQNYFHYIKEIGINIIPYYLNEQIDSYYLDEIKQELNKYDPNLFLINKYLYNMTKSIQNNYKDQELYEGGYKLFKQTLYILSQTYKTQDIKECLLNQAIHNENIDLFRFSNDIPYQDEILYQHFINLKTQISTKFIFPYFPLNYDYVKSLVDILRMKSQKQCILNRQSIQNKIKSNQIAQQSIIQQQVSHDQDLCPQKNIETINNIKSNEIVQTRRINMSAILSRTLQKLFSNQLYKALKNIQNFSKFKTNKLESLVYIVEHYQKINYFKSLIQYVQIDKLQSILQQIILKRQQQSFAILNKYHKEIYQRKLYLSQRFRNKQLFKKGLNSLICNLEQKQYKKQAILDLYQTLSKISYNFQQNDLLTGFYKCRWYSCQKLKKVNSLQLNRVSIDEQTRIKTKSSFSTRYGRNASQALSQRDKSVQLSNRNHSSSQGYVDNKTNPQLMKQEGTNIYCEYVVIQKKSKKKKKAKSTKQNKQKQQNVFVGKCSSCIKIHNHKQETLKKQKNNI